MAYATSLSTNVTAIAMLLTSWPATMMVGVYGTKVRAYHPRWALYVTGVAQFAVELGVMGALIIAPQSEKAISVVAAAFVAVNVTEIVAFAILFRRRRRNVAQPR